MTEVDRSIETGAKYLLMVVWRNKLLFVVSALIFSTATAWVTLTKQPEFEATAQLISGQGGLEEASTGNRKPVQLPAALSIIAESQEVLRAAVEQVGLDRIVGQPGPEQPSARERLRKLIATLRQKLNPQPVAEPPRTLNRIDVLLPLVKVGLAVRADPKADILTISYRHRDPSIAAQTANAIAMAVVDRQVEIYSRPGATAFFAGQQQRFEEQYKKAASELEQFSVRTRTYSSTDQREMLLRRLNDLAAALSTTRGRIADKTGERQALGDALRRLAPVARSPYVSALVDSLGGDRDRTRPSDTRLDDRTSDPPLLLIKVYQDSMSDLFKLNSEIVGAQSLQQQQTAELTLLTAELNTLSENQLRYSELRRIVDQSAYNLDAFSKRTIDEQISAESNTARFSSVKVLQQAVTPVIPVSPNMKLDAVLAVAGGLIVGLTAALLRQWTRRPGSRKKVAMRGTPAHLLPAQASARRDV